MTEHDPIGFYTEEAKKLGLGSIWELPLYALREMRDHLAKLYPEPNPYVYSYEEEIAYKQRQEQILRGE